MAALLELSDDDPVNDEVENVSDAGATWRPTEAQIRELERRIAAADEDPSSGSSWDDVKDRLLSRYG